MKKNINTSRADISAADFNRLHESIRIITDGAFMVSSIEESVKEYMPEGSRFVEDTKKAWQLLDEALDILMVNYVPYANDPKLVRSKKQDKNRVTATDLSAIEVTETIEEVITKIEAIAYLVESIGINVKFTGVPSDENLISYASTHLYSDLIGVTYCLGDLVSRLGEETAPEVTE